MNRPFDRVLAGATLALLAISGRAFAQPKDALAPIRDSLTFSASFESGPNADFAKGDKQVYTGEAGRKNPKPGLSAGEVEVAKGKGRGGGNALRFIKKSSKIVFYQAAKNVDYRKQNWSGAISFWLSLDPNRDLGNWYCDPIQITEKGWSNGAFWVDFSKDEKPKHFRLGAFADLKVWNRTDRDPSKIPVAERPMYPVTRPPFAQGKWTHIAFTFEHFNTGKTDGVAKLYLDGKFQGAVSKWNQRITWNPEKAAIQIGIAYVGLYDDLAIFNRALSDSEVQLLFKHQGALVKSK